MIQLILEADILTDSCRILQSMLPGLEAGGECTYTAFLKRLEEQICPEDRKEIRSVLSAKRLLDWPAKEEARTIYARFAGKGENVWTQSRISCAAIRRDTASLVMLAVYEVREGRTVEKLLAQLSAARKNERAKTDFLARMSHDIRTPINGIIGMTDIARSIEGNPGKTRDCLNKIRMSSDYLLMLINNILDMSKIESGKMEHTRDIISLDELIQRMKDTYSLTVEKKAVRYRVAMEGVTVRECIGDKLWLYQILNNLLSNAFKFIEPNGRVALIIKQRNIEKGRVFFQFTVMDDGAGISEEFKERIYDPFIQEIAGEGAPAEGSGLGLSICRELVEQMNGSIRVDSQKGEGTRFDVFLPFEIKENEAKADRQAEEEAYNLAGKRVLLVEDNELNMEVALFLLGQKEILAETAEDGAKAVALFEESALWYYDAVLMDVRMPVMDGMEATRRIRSLKREDAADVPIIAMTANAFKEDMDDCLAAGMDAHIAKPIEKADMYGVLGRCLTFRQAD